MSGTHATELLRLDRQSSGRDVGADVCVECRTQERSQAMRHTPLAFAAVFRRTESSFPDLGQEVSAAVIAGNAGSALVQTREHAEGQQETRHESHTSCNDRAFEQVSPERRAGAVGGDRTQTSTTPRRRTT